MMSWANRLEQFRLKHPSWDHVRSLDAAGRQSSDAYKDEEQNERNVSYADHRPFD